MVRAQARAVGGGPAELRCAAPHPRLRWQRCRHAMPFSLAHVIASVLEATAWRGSRRGYGRTCAVIAKVWADDRRRACADGEARRAHGPRACKVRFVVKLAAVVGAQRREPRSEFCRAATSPSTAANPRASERAAPKRRRPPAPPELALNFVHPAQLRGQTAISASVDRTGDRDDLSPEHGTESPLVQRTG